MACSATLSRLLARDAVEHARPQCTGRSVESTGTAVRALDPYAIDIRVTHGDTDLGLGRSSRVVAHASCHSMWLRHV